MRKILLALVMVSGWVFAADAEILVKDGQKIAFMGDSITQFGWDNPGGYVRLTVSGLQANGITVTPLPSGVSGQTSRDMLKRLGKTLERKPDWFLLCCGVNDVRIHAKGDTVNGVPLDEYKANVSAMVGQAAAAGAQVMLLTPTPAVEDADHQLNAQLAGYVEFLLSLAGEKKLALADLNAEEWAAIQSGPKTGRYLTADGLHMNPRGDQVMAAGVLKALGLDDAQLQKAREAWERDIPDLWSIRYAAYGSSKPKSLYLTLRLTKDEYEGVEAAMARQGRKSSVMEFLRRDFELAHKSLFTVSGGKYENMDAVFAAGEQEQALDYLRQRMRARVAELISGQ